jgi:hypothetical protein
MYCVIRKKERKSSAAFLDWLQQGAKREWHLGICIRNMGCKKTSLQQLDAKRTGKKILHYHRLLLLLCLREIRPTCTPLPAPARDPGQAAVLPARHLGKAIVTPLRPNRARPSPPPPSFASWGPRFGGPGRWSSNVDPPPAFVLAVGVELVGVLPPFATRLAARLLSYGPPWAHYLGGPLPRWVPVPTTRWAPGTTRLALQGTWRREAQWLWRRSTRLGSCTCPALYGRLLDVLD